MTKAERDRLHIAVLESEHTELGEHIEYLKRVRYAPDVLKQAMQLIINYAQESDHIDKGVATVVIHKLNALKQDFLDE